MNHPVRFEVELPEGRRDRISALFRPLLIIPHLMLVGGPVMGLLGGGYRTGVLGALALVCAFFDWVMIVVTGRPLEGLQAWKRTYMTWRARVLAYAAFLRDEYPPFGDQPYPARLELPDAPVVRDRLSVALRPIYALPHALVLGFLLLLWVVVGFVTWLMLAITGQVSASLLRFSRDVMAYSLRLEAYLLLLHDEFPPFVLTEEAGDLYKDLQQDRSANSDLTSVPAGP
jgi:hypothetical protein